jgi:hypothetical protein
MNFYLALKTFAALSLVVTLSACGGGGSGSGSPDTSASSNTVASADVKTDVNANPVIDVPIVNPAPSLPVPTPVTDIVPPTITSPVPGSINLLNSNFSGGTASVVTITAYSSLTGLEDINLVYNSDLTRNCTESWSASGSLCNTNGTADDKTTSVQSSNVIGATWIAKNANSVGVLIIDAGSVISFSEARVFQMFSDGKTTQIRLSAHSGTGSTVPGWNDAGWSVITPGSNGISNVGASVRETNNNVTSPTVLSLGARSSRYIKVEAYNNGIHGDGVFIELRSLKLF